MYYTYRITFEDGCYYYGVRKSPEGDPFKDPYVGSPVTFKEKWTHESFTKEVLDIFDTWEEASTSEAALIRKVYKKDPKCLNRNCSGAIHPDLCKVGGSKKDPAKRKADSSKGGRKAALVNREKGTAIFGMSPEQKASAGREGGKTSGKNNVTSGHLEAIRPLAAKVQHSQRWVNTHPGYDPYISTPCGLTHWQNKRNIPTSFRRKVSQ